MFHSPPFFEGALGSFAEDVEQLTKVTTNINTCCIKQFDLLVDQYKMSIKIIVKLEAGETLSTKEFEFLQLIMRAYGKNGIK